MIIDGNIVIDLGSRIVTIFILGLLAYMGWTVGFRYMLSIALFLTIGYLLTVQGGSFVVGLVNRFYTNGPRLAAFALGRDPTTVEALPPLIPDNFQAPLLLRILVFGGLLAVGYGYAWPWETKLKPSDKFTGVRQMRVLGALTGLYIGVLTITALATFWAESGGTVDLPTPLVAILDGLPNFAGIIPSVMAAFFILLIIIIILRFNRIFKPDPQSSPPSGGHRH